MGKTGARKSGADSAKAQNYSKKRFERDEELDFENLTQQLMGGVSVHDAMPDDLYDGDPSESEDSLKKRW